MSSAPPGRRRPDPSVTTAGQWVAGARPRTLPLAVGPVLVGTAAASMVGPTIWWRFAAALVVSLALQVGVNYANDYSDGLRGTDRDRRGPLRLTASGTASARSVRRAAWMALAAAAAVGTALAVAVDLRLLLLGVVCVAGAWLYSGGRHPYGYHGLGEVAVLFFFGFVATLGSAYVQHRTLPSAAWWGSLVVGLPACAVLVVNNLRDIDTDGVAGKRTLAVRMGGGARGPSTSVCSLLPSWPSSPSPSSTRRRPSPSPLRPWPQLPSGASWPATTTQLRSCACWSSPCGWPSPWPCCWPSGWHWRERPAMAPRPARGSPGRPRRRPLRVGRGIVVPRVPVRTACGCGRRPRGSQPSLAHPRPGGRPGQRTGVRGGLPAGGPRRVRLREGQGGPGRPPAGSGPRRRGARRRGTAGGPPRRRQRRLGRGHRRLHDRTPVRFDLELVEQPVRTIPAMARVRRRVRAPLAADECVRSLEDARLLHRLEAADAVVLKVQPLGGDGAGAADRRGRRPPGRRHLHDGDLGRHRRRSAPRRLPRRAPLRLRPGHGSRG